MTDSFPELPYTVLPRELFEGVNPSSRDALKFIRAKVTPTVIGMEAHFLFIVGEQRYIVEETIPVLSSYFGDGLVPMSMLLRAPGLAIITQHALLCYVDGTLHYTFFLIDADGNKKCHVVCFL
jgi:hypothetical protein